MESELLAVLADAVTVAAIDRVWDGVSADFEAASASMPVRFMERRELSFHSYVKLLGFLCLLLRDVPGGIVEIGVWKGKSLTFMSRLAGNGAQLVGIDPCELPGQPQELAYFHQRLFSNCAIIPRYSQDAIEDALHIVPAFKLLHIDGGHLREHVWADFLLYERFVVPGGYIVFDDYGDRQYSPQVGPAVDRLRSRGLFSGYEIIGQPPGYEASFVLRKSLTP